MKIILLKLAKQQGVGQHNYLLLRNLMSQTVLNLNIEILKLKSPNSDFCAMPKSFNARQRFTLKHQIMNLILRLLKIDYFELAVFTSKVYLKRF